MLSALVQYLTENDAGSGFFELAKSLGLLPPNADADKRLEFWQGQVKAVIAYYHRPPK
jgi:hypothetical protein